MAPRLGYEVHVSPQVQQSGRGTLPDGSPRMWSPISTTLVRGEQDAVLIDPPMTADQAEAVVAWVEASGCNLVGIYITHGHADHWLGAIPLGERYPTATVYATEATKAMMAVHGSPEFRATFWDAIFPGQLPKGDLEVQTVSPSGIALEDSALIPIEVGHTDTDDTTMLYVPDIGLVVSGDAIYNGVHPYLAESGGAAGIDAWLAALDVAADLEPLAIIAGHKDPEADDDPVHIEHTRRYLQDARELLATSSDAQEFYEKMLAKHPDRINPGAVWSGAVALFPKK